MNGQRFLRPLRRNSLAPLAVIRNKDILFVPSSEKRGSLNGSVSCVMNPGTVVRDALNPKSFKICIVSFVKSSACPLG